MAHTGFAPGTVVALKGRKRLWRVDAQDGQVLIATSIDGAAIEPQGSCLPYEDVCLLPRPTMQSFPGLTPSANPQSAHGKMRMLQEEARSHNAHALRYSTSSTLPRQLINERCSHP